MNKIFFVVVQFLMLVTLSSGVFAQEAKDKDKKPATSTVDAWRSAMPQNEQPSNAAVVVPEESRDNVEVRETEEQTRNRILDLEQRLMESLKNRDSVSLDHLIADEFVLAGLAIPGSTPDKGRFIKWVQNQLQLKTYEIGKTTVRVFPATAIVSINYRRQANVAGVSSDGDFTVTNVWVRRGKLWKIASHHISPSTIP